MCGLPEDFFSKIADLNKYGMRCCIMLCGLQGSGKSTLAQQIRLQNNWFCVSSDVIREGFPSLNNDQVFRQVYKDINSYLRAGANVVFDATNITLKSRHQFFENVKVPCYKVCYVMNTPYEECVERVKSRNITSSHQVPLEVLKRYYYSFQIPFLEEGFDLILLHNLYSDKDCQKYLKYINNQMVGFDQSSKYHTETLDKHVQDCYQYLHTSYGISPYYALGQAATLHDIGKLFTRTRDEEGNYHFYGHENVGAYEYITHAASDTANKYDVLQTCLLINYHMILHSNLREKRLEYYKKLFGKILWEKLEMLYEADCFASEGKEDV